MDRTREIRLATFRAEMKNLSLPLRRKKLAARAFYRVKRQMRDKTLTKLRYMYLKADAAADNQAREDIGDRIEIYMMRVYKQRI